MMSQTSCLTTCNDFHHQEPTMRTPPLRRARRIAGAAAVACAVFAATAHAAVYRLDVQAKGFVTDVGTLPAPTDPVSGTIIFQAVNLDSKVTSIDFVDLRIGGHSYVPEEPAAENLSTAIGESGFILFGGKLNRVNGLFARTDDFYSNTRPDIEGSQFAYTTAGAFGLWSSSDHAVSILAVPEPNTYVLLLAGLSALAWVGSPTRWAGSPAIKPLSAPCAGPRQARLGCQA
jgi:hypothetical protein